MTRQEWLLAGPGQHSLTREFAVVPVLRSQLSIALHCLSLLILVWQQHHNGARLEYFLPVLLNHVIPFFKKSYYFLDEVTAIAALVKTQNTNATNEEEYRANPAVIPETLPFFIDFSL